MSLLLQNRGKDIEHLMLTSLKVLQFFKCEINFVYNVNESDDVSYIK